MHQALLDTLGQQLITNDALLGTESVKHQISQQKKNSWQIKNYQHERNITRGKVNADW